MLLKPSAPDGAGGEPSIALLDVRLAFGPSTPTVTLNQYVHEWPDALDRTRWLVDGMLGIRETAVTSAGSRA